MERVRNHSLFIFERGDRMSEANDVNELLTLVRMDIRELTTEVRNIKDMQAMVIDHNTKIYANEGSVITAHKRLDKVDRMVYAVITAVIVSWLGLVIWIAQNASETVPPL